MDVNNILINTCKPISGLSYNFIFSYLLTNSKKSLLIPFHPSNPPILFKSTLIYSINHNFSSFNPQLNKKLRKIISNLALRERYLYLTTAKCLVVQVRYRAETVLHRPKLHQSHVLLPGLLQYVHLLHRTVLPKDRPQLLLLTYLPLHR